MRRFTALLAGSLLLAACGGDSTAPTTTMAGHWSGTVSTGATMAISLSESGGVVSGDGAIGNNVVTVHGTHTPNSTSILDLSFPGGGTISFNVEVLLPKSMSGHLYGGAYDNHVAILNRQ